VFSPDGRSIAYLRWSADERTQLVVVPLGGQDLGRPIGPSAPVGPDGPTITNYAFTPDGTAIIANYSSEQVNRLMPIDGSSPSILVRGDLAFATVQRLAP
jgi:hypothetical protein